MEEAGSRKSILDRLDDPARWLALLTYRREKGHMTGWEERDLCAFIEHREYLPVVEGIRRGEPFALPRRICLNKKSTGKKRIVFSFPRAENYVLKLLAAEMNDFDGLFTRDLYSFRRGKSVRDAVRRLSRIRGLGEMYSVKLDIHDYFTSVSPDDMIEVLAPVREADPALSAFLEALLREPFVLDNGVKVSCRKGILAGAPTAGFMADLYLDSLDRWFGERGIPYARYSDDMVFFTPTGEEAETCEAHVREHLAARGLSVNERKTVRTGPGEPWEFLGFSFSDGQVDVSRVSVEKIKAKLRRKVRAFKRWQRKRDAGDDQTMRAFIRYFNRKFYDNPIDNEITWARWYFPEITTTDSLREIDRYMVDCIRSIPARRHTKARFNLRYETIRELGFRPLVSEYFRMKEESATEAGT